MPGPILHLAAAGCCPHGGMMNIVATSPRVMLSGANAAVLTDMGLVAGCAFNIAGKPQPCVTTRWMVGTTRVTSMGLPLLINPAMALCLSPEQIPAGPPIVTTFQTRVIAT